MSVTVTSLASFTAGGSYVPAGAVSLDAAGDLFVTTAYNAAVFELTYNAASGTYSGANQIASLAGIGGSLPFSGVTVAPNGDLFGTTAVGGNGFGLVYEVAYTPGAGYASTPELITAFNGSDGATPYGGLIMDSAGDLFGTTYSGGPSGGGEVYEITYSAAGGYASTPQVIGALGSSTGTNPEMYDGNLVMDAQGDLFGVASTGGLYGYGTVFEVACTPGQGYVSGASAVASFMGSNGNSPSGTLVMDAKGDLFGTTQFGGAGFGTVFEIAYTPGSGYANMPLTLVSFNGADGYRPLGGLTIDAKGNLFGTTMLGGTANGGTAFEITYSAATGYSSTPETLANFDTSMGVEPYSVMAGTASGALVGTLAEGGGSGGGAVYELTGTDYAPLCFYPGTCIRTTQGDVPVEALTTDHVAITPEGEMPISWLGRSEVALRLADSLAVLPIRIRAGALGGGLPVRDLLVSPGHALLVGGVLAEARALVNGTSIMRETDVPAAFTYYHVELPRHALLYAAGALAESFVDNAERMTFSNWDERAPTTPTGEMNLPRAKSARQVPRAVREQLAAAALGGHEAPCSLPWIPSAPTPAPCWS
jgi:hypothetical protein